MYGLTGIKGFQSALPSGLEIPQVNKMRGGGERNFPENILKDLSFLDRTEENKALIGRTSTKFSGKPAKPATTFPVWISITSRSCCKEIQSVGDFCGS